MLDWGPATLKLIDRDQWIGWNGPQRADRRDLIVQNRRFLLLSTLRMPNLASRCLSMALKALSSQWQQAYGYKPLLAETFTDIERFEGTCYKASNWIALGQTKGFKRHRADPKPRSEDNKTDGELTVSKELYRNSELHDAVVTADALHDKQSIARAIIAQGGDYLLQSKDARRAPMKTAGRLDKTATPFFTQL